MYNSFASERLIKLIDYKIKRYNELAASNPESPALKYIDGEIKSRANVDLPPGISNCHNMVNVDEKFRDELLKRIERIKDGERDLYF